MCCFFCLVFSLLVYLHQPFAMEGFRQSIEPVIAATPSSKTSPLQRSSSTVRSFLIRFWKNKKKRRKQIQIDVETFCSWDRTAKGRRHRPMATFKSTHRAIATSTRRACFVRTCRFATCSASRKMPSANRCCHWKTRRWRRRRAICLS